MAEAGTYTKAGAATGNPYALAAGAALDVASGAGATGQSPSTATQDYGSLDLSDRRINVGNTGLNLGAIMLPFQENKSNGGFGADVLSRWLNKSYGPAPNTALPAETGTLVDSLGEYATPLTIAAGVLLVVLIVGMRRKK